MRVPQLVACDLNCVCIFDIDDITLAEYKYNLAGQMHTQSPMRKMLTYDMDVCCC